VQLNAQGLDVVGTVGTAREIGQVKLDLIPSLVQTHRHGTNERLHASGRLVVGRAEAAADVLVVQDLDLEGEVLLQVLDDHHQERELDTEGLLRVGRAGDEVGGHVGAHDLQDGGLNVVIGQSLDVTIADLLVPDLQRLGTDRVEDRQET